MGFIAPWQLAWLGLLAPLVLLYVLKRRRQIREIGSTLLWELALRDLRAERPWKKLLPQVALFLQIAVLVLGALALARPAGAGRVPSGSRLAVVIDTSASMAAHATRDGRTTRLDEALRVARDQARSLPPGGEMLLIEASAEPSLVAPSTSDGTALEHALDRVRVRGGRADLEAAVALASERLRGAPSGSRVVVLTDAAMDGELALDGRLAPVETRRVGETAAGAADNTAIVALDVRPKQSDGTDASPDRAEIFVRVARYGATPADVSLTATDSLHGVIASRRVTVRSGEPLGVVMTADLPPDPHGRASVVRVELERRDQSDDALALDDIAVAPSPAARRLPVYLVGDAPRPVARVLRADPDVDLYETTLERLAAEPDHASLDGLFVYAGEAPAAPPASDVAVVAPTGDAVFGLPLGPRATGPRVVTWDVEAPALRFVGFSDVHLRSARAIGGGARALLTTDAGPVIASMPRPAGETTIVAFDPTESDWPLRPSFVVFFRNLTERARVRRASGGIVAGAAGDPLRVPAADGAEVHVRTPAGEEVTAIARGSLAVVPVGAETGVYTVTLPGGRTLTALRNMLDPRESDLRPRARFTVAGHGANVVAATRSDPREAWPWFVGALLFFLLAEALWATRSPLRTEVRGSRGAGSPTSPGSSRSPRVVAHFAQPGGAGVPDPQGPSAAPALEPEGKAE